MTVEPRAPFFAPFTPEHKAPWLEFMAEVQANSGAWEAVYTSKPDFDAGLDHVLICSNRLAGIISGWRMVQGAGRPSMSAEVLAVHPDFRGRGFGRLLIARALAALGPGSALHFFTSEPSACAFYERLGLQLGRCRLRTAGPVEGNRTQRSQMWYLEEKTEGNLREYIAMAPEKA